MHISFTMPTIHICFFPTLIYAEDVKLDNQQLGNDIVAWSKQDKGVKKTNMNGWHSQTNMHEMPQFKLLVDELFKMQHQMYKEEWLDRQPKIGFFYTFVLL